MNEARALARSSNWKDADDNWIYPPNDGFEGARRVVTIGEGKIIDRYGNPNGKFFSPMGTVLPGRALPPGTSGQPSRFRVEREGGLRMYEGPATAWFGQPGGGTQYRTVNEQNTRYMLNQGWISEWPGN